MHVNSSREIDRQKNQSSDIDAKLCLIQTNEVDADDDSFTRILIRVKPKICIANHLQTIEASIHVLAH